jgi:prophage regulatory protein
VQELTTSALVSLPAPETSERLLKPDQLDDGPREHHLGVTLWWAVMSTELAMRICRKCDQERPETEFYSTARDGYEPCLVRVCNTCNGDRVRRRAGERKTGAWQRTEVATTAAKPVEAETKNSAPDNEPRPRRMLSEKQVLEIVPVGRTTLYRMEKSGRFPRSTYISPNRRVWYEDQTIAWQAAVDEFDPNRGRGKGRRRHVSRTGGS